MKTHIMDLQEYKYKCKRFKYTNIVYEYTLSFMYESQLFCFPENSLMFTL